MTKTSAASAKDATEAKDEAKNKAKPKAATRAKSGEKTKAPAAKATQVKEDPQYQHKDKVAAYMIIGPKRGRYRAGRYFNAEAQRIEAGDLSDAEIKALKADP